MSLYLNTIHNQLIYSSESNSHKYHGEVVKTKFRFGEKKIEFLDPSTAATNACHFTGVLLKYVNAFTKQIQIPSTNPKTLKEIINCTRSSEEQKIPQDQNFTYTHNHYFLYKRFQRKTLILLRYLFLRSQLCSVQTQISPNVTGLLYKTWTKKSFFS